MRKIYQGRKAGEGDFIFKIDTTHVVGGATSNSDQFFIPILNGTSMGGWVVAFHVDWGDGSTSDVNSSNYATECLHTYTTGGIYTITCSGTVAGWAFQGAILYDDAEKMLDIMHWGCFKLDGGRASSGVGLQFWGCINLTQISAPDIINNREIYGTISSRGWRGTFADCVNLERINRLNDWRGGNNQTSGYGGVTNFQINIMFANCEKLQFSDMATGAIDLSGWDVRGCHLFERMFQDAEVFDGKLFSGMGQQSWTIPALDLNRMFQRAYAFTGTNSITEMQAWDISTCDDTWSMFENATLFNIDIGGWDTSSVITAQGMFQNATSFDQDISSWTIHQVTNLLNFMTGATLSTSNYDALLVGWDAQGAMSYSGTVDFGNSTYSLGTAAATARASLITKWGAILDGGGV